MIPIRIANHVGFSHPEGDIIQRNEISCDGDARKKHKNMSSVKYIFN